MNGVQLRTFENPAWATIFNIVFEDFAISDSIVNNTCPLDVMTIRINDY